MVSKLPMYVTEKGVPGPDENVKLIDSARGLATAPLPDANLFCPSMRSLIVPDTVI